MHKIAREQIDRAPDTPGVYLFKGTEGKVLYVGKAKCLKDRLKSYVVPGRDTRPSIPLMIPLVKEVEWILTDNEKEALILENNLIKAHRPRFNIMFRDDKSYVSLKMTKHSFPRLFVTRKIVKDGSEYFGPYSSSYDLRQTLKLIQKIFQLRDCADSFYSNRSRPCLQYQIKRCTAPCVGFSTEAQYAEQVKQTRLFISGDKKELQSKLKSQMFEASQGMRYEEAATLRDRIAAVDETLKPQHVESRKDRSDADAIGLSGDEQATLIKVLKVREGRMNGADEFLVSEPISAAAEITRSFLQQYYLSDTLGREPPQQIYVGQVVSDAKIFEALLSETKGMRVYLNKPARGKGFKLLRLADRNAASTLFERKRRSEKNQDLLLALQKLLHLTNVPKRIEGYDISNLSGTEPYGSQVVFVDGEADKNKYRYYRIRSVKGPNDFASLREVFERRFRRLEEGEAPDLILVDGGKGQLKQLVDVVREMGIEGIDMASIAKEKEFKSRSGKRYAPERIFLPGQKNPIVFVPSSPILHLLVRVRDEAHRFGITRHRKSRGKTALQSVLSQIPGIGMKRKKLLIRSMGTVEKIQGASVQDLKAVPGLTAQAAEGVYKYFHDSPEGEE